ncbi:MAG: hypothetical protein QXZ44_06465 [Ferroplasma sp.]
MEFNINGGKIILKESLLQKLKHKIILIQSANEVINCDSGMCEVSNNIQVKLKKKCDMENILYYMNGDVEIAIDYHTYDSLNAEDLSLGYGRNIIIDQCKHKKLL